MATGTEETEASFESQLVARRADAAASAQLTWMRAPRKIPTPRLDALLAVLDRHGFHPGDYVLCGSACLAIEGYRDVRDLDVLVNPERWDSYAKQIEALKLEPPLALEGLEGFGDPPPVTTKHEGSGEGFVGLNRHVVLCEVGIDLFDGMPRIGGFSFNEIADDALHSHSRMWVHPKHCLAVKVLAERKRDFHDMRVLLKHLAWMNGVGPDPRQIIEPLEVP